MIIKVQKSLKVIKQVTTFSLLLSVLLTSCNGQNKLPNENDTTIIPLINTIIPIGTITAQPVQNIRSVLHDKNGNYWLGSDGDGVYRYDGKTMILFTEKDGLCQNQVRTIQEDKSGNIWFGTGNGLCCYDGKTFKNSKDYAQISALGSLPNVWFKAPGDIWFPDANGGIYRYNGDVFSNYQFPDAEIDSKSSSLPYNQYDIYCIFEDRARNLWFGTQSKGVCRFDGKNFTWLSDKELAGAAVRTIFEDKAGNIWFGNNGYGLFRYDGKSLMNFTAEKGLSNPDFFKNFQEKEGTLARVWTINEDANGDLWIGTIDAGAWRYDGKNLTNYTTKDGLADNGVTVIYKDKKGELLFGTAVEICKFDGKTFKKYAFK